MAFDPRKIVSFMNMLPDSYTGEAGKVMVLNTAEDAFEMLPMGSLKATGVIFMWPTDTPPTGALMMNGQTIAYEDYPALFAEFGLSSGTLILKAINFAKNSLGVNTYTDEEEGVGDHGHIANTVPGHGHGGSVGSVGNHTHQYAMDTDNNCDNSGQTRYIAANYPHDTSNTTSAAGGHSHSLSISAGGVHTPVIQPHTGTTQPSCTLLNFCIWT